MRLDTRRCRKISSACPLSTVTVESVLTELLQTITFGYAQTIPAAKHLFDVLILIDVVLLGLW